MLVISDELADELCSAQRLLAGALGDEPYAPSLLDRHCVACQAQDDADCPAVRDGDGTGDVPIQPGQAPARAGVLGRMPASGTRARTEELIRGEAR